MLLYRSHWHFASERDPEKEARLVHFADSPDAFTPPPPPPNPQAGTEFGPKEGPVDPTVAKKASGKVRNEIEENRKRTEEAMNGNEPVAPPNEKKKGKNEEDNGTTAEEEKEVLTPITVAQGFTDLQSEFEKIKQQRLDPKIAAALKTLKETDVEEWNKATEAFHIFEKECEVLAELQDRAMRLKEWREGSLTPNAMKAFLQRAYKDRPDIGSILTSFDSACDNPDYSDSIRRWNEGALQQASEKDVIAQHLWDAVNGETLLEELQAYLNKWTEYAEAMQKLLTLDADTEKKREEAIAEEKARKNKKSGSLLSRIAHLREQGIGGVTLYSPMEWIEAIKKIAGDFTEAYKEHADLMQNKLGGAITGAMAAMHLPYGEVVNRRSQSRQESDFSKKKNEYKEELGNDDFNTLVRKFHTVLYEPSKAIGVLEVAAGHGWLYELSDLSDDEAWPVHIFGQNFSDITPPHWDETQKKNFISTLRRQNASGANDEEQKGKDRMKGQDNKEVYMRKFRGALKANNYWQAIGIGEALFDVGKMPEASEFLTIAMLQHLRQDDLAKKYMTPTVLRAFSTKRWNEATTYSQNMIVMDMDSIQKMRRDPAVMEGNLLGTIGKLEQEIRQISGKGLEEDGNVALAAKILSGQTGEVNKKKISIYRNQYRNYWDEKKNPVFGTYKGEAFVSKIPTDYYAAASFLQLPSSAVTAGYATGSTGTLDHPEFAQNFAGYAIQRLEELKRSDPRAAEVFRLEMGRKFADALKTGITNRANEQLHTYHWKQGNFEGDGMLAGLIHHNFITLPFIVQLAKNKPAFEEFEKSLKEQLKNIESGKSSPRTHTLKAKKSPPSASLAI